ncbi:hypothetical protein ZTR_11130 [Talaromyces verruculosus]|nr:hypothetical protein ZTR_11130 [Talaromyces verruculosus]
MEFIGGKYLYDVNNRLDDRGRVYQGTDIDSGQPVAIKRERADEAHTLKNEAHVYHELSGGVGIPFVLSASDIKDDDGFLVMEPLGPDLQSLFNMYGREFSLKTLPLIADQLISRVEYIHSRSFIHGDITPKHLAVGRGVDKNQVYVISFGRAKYYRDPRSHEHKSYLENEQRACSIPYMSIHAHKGITPSRRDDMEAVGNVLLYLNLGSLPWGKLDIDVGLDVIEEMKISIEKSCPDALAEILVYFKHVRSLKFDEKPNYSYLRKIFRDLHERQFFRNDYLFDWVVDRPAAIDVQRRFNNDKTTKEQLQQLCDSTQTLSIQEAVPGEPSLTEILDRINSILLSQEEEISNEYWKLRNEDPSTIEWRYFVGDVGSLLYQMWANRPSSISYLLDFARTAYRRFTVALDYAPELRAAWFESLGRLSQYTMCAVTELESRDLHARIADYWYWKAAALNPGTGRIQHHLAVTSRPDVLKQLFFHLKALISVQPYPWTRETIKSLFAGLPQMATSFPADRQALIVFVETHSLLFRGEDNYLFIQHANKFLSQLDEFASIPGNGFREQGVYIVASNYAAIFGYGHDDSEMLTIFGMAKPIVEHRAQNIKNSSQDVSLASQLAFATLSILLKLQDHGAALPSVHFSLAFLWCLAMVPRAMDQIQAYVPWKQLAEYLNMLITPDIDMSEIENAEFPRNDFGPVPQFAEDFFIRGFCWSQPFYSQGFFRDLEEGREYDIGFPPVKFSREKRCLRLGTELAKCERWLKYNSEECKFGTTQFANTVQDFSRLFRYPTAIKECPLVLRSLIKAHGILFNGGDDSTFDKSAKQFWTGFDTHMTLVDSNFQEQGIFILASNYTAIFDYGSPPDHRAPHFAFATLNVVLRRWDNAAGLDDADSLDDVAILDDTASLEVMLPSLYISLAFLWCTVQAGNMTHISQHVPWIRIANVLNKLIRLDRRKERYMQQPSSPWHLKEDDLIRGLSWSGKCFDRIANGDEAWTEGVSATGLRIKRCLWLGKELARDGLLLSYS